MKKILLILTTFINYCHTASANDFQLSKVAKPLSQQIFLELDPTKSQFSGNTSLNIEIVSTTKEFEVSSRDHTITQAEIISESNKKCQLKMTPVSHHKVKLSCDQELPAGKHQVTLSFSGKYNLNAVGLYKTMTQGLPYLYTQFEAIEARRVFPSFDEPEYKIPFQVSIKSPEKFNVYSNTNIDKIEKINGYTTHTFKQTHPLPSYLLAFAVGEFEEVQITGLPIPGKIITTKGRSKFTKFAAQEIPKILQFLESYFGTKYPYEKLDTLAASEFPYGAMENPGLVVYRDSSILFDIDQSSEAQRLAAIRIIAHELAHQWFGNLVTMKWWNDLWLNESFASWMEKKVLSQLYPEFETDLQVDHLWTMKNDALLNSKAIRKDILKESDIFDGLGRAYSKGSAVLKMVENWVSEEYFQDGVKAYINQFSHKNAEASDLWQAISKASGIDINGIMKSYIELPSFPVVDVKIKGRSITISQKRFSISGVNAPPQMWLIPIVLRFGDGNKVTSRKILLDTPTTTFEGRFDPKWIFVNQSALGYFDWTAEEHIIDELLAMKNFLPIQDRLGLVATSKNNHLMGHINLERYLKILDVLLTDEHPLVVSKVLGELLAIEKIFVNRNNKTIWNTLISKKAEAILKKIKLYPDKNDSHYTSKLRAVLIEIVGLRSNDKKLLQYAKKEALLYTKGKKISDHVSISNLLKIHAKHGSLSDFNDYKKTISTSNIPTVRQNIVNAMGYFQSEKVLPILHSHLLSQNVNSLDFFDIFEGLAYEFDNISTLQNWTKENFNSISKKIPMEDLSQVLFLSTNVCDSTSYKESVKLFDPQKLKNQFIELALSKLKETHETCISMQNRDKIYFDKYLTNSKTK